MTNRMKVATVVISDVHLGSEHSKVEELTAFLKSVDCGFCFRLGRVAGLYSRILSG